METVLCAPLFTRIKEFHSFLHFSQWNQAFSGLLLLIILTSDFLEPGHKDVHLNDGQKETNVEIVDGDVLLPCRNR